MVRRDLSKRVFLVGAGISMAHPSKLPSGSQLSARIFDLLTETGPVFLESAAIYRLRQKVKSRVRLEIFLETLSSQISPQTVFSPFQLFRHAEPNFGHLALAELAPFAIVTTNQDLLLEEAGKRLGSKLRILHVHGRCNDIRSIVTIISQYLGGLESQVRRSFQRLVAKRKVVVVGYSGRDVDVMSQLIKASPQHVTWIVHTVSGHRPAIWPELSQAKATLGSRLDIVYADTDEWFAEHLSESSRVRIRMLQRRRSRLQQISPRVKKEFARISDEQRNRAIARVLEHFGQYQDAATIYRRLFENPSANRPELLLDLGESAAREVGYEASLQIFSQLLDLPKLSLRVRAHALLGTADALRNLSQHDRAKQSLGQLEELLRRPELKQRDTKEYWRLRGWALIARAGVYRIGGHAKSADRLYERAERAFSRGRDVNGRIEVLTWRAETAVILGDYDSALFLSEQALLDADAYAKYLVKGWPSYVQAEALALSGRFTGALDKLAYARKMFKASKNRQGPIWSLLLEADCLKEVAAHKVDRVLRKVGRKLRGHNFTHAQGRLCLEEADAARGVRDWDRLARTLASLAAYLDNRNAFAVRPPLLAAHAALVEAESARQRGDPVSVDLLRNVRKAYERIGAKAFVARVNVALWLSGQSDVPFRSLLQHCRQHGFRLEEARLRKSITGLYPIHFV